MEDNLKVIQPKTQWYFAKPNKGWKVGIRMIRFNGRDYDEIQIQRWRTNKQKQWVPTRKWINLRLFDGKQVLDILLKKMLMDYATQNREATQK